MHEGSARSRANHTQRMARSGDGVAIAYATYGVGGAEAPAVVLVHGWAGDRTFPTCKPTDVDSMRRHGVEPIVLEGVGHFLMIEDPEQFNPVLAATLASFA